MAILPCKETDCQRKVLSRGMCSTHYSYWHRAKNGRVDKTYTKTCAQCAGPFSTTTKRTVFCSLICAQAARPRNVKPSALVKYQRPRVWLGQTLATTRQVWVAGQCAYCPTYFVGRGGSSYCSSKCKMNAKFKRRYDARGEFKVTDTIRLGIYERDNYTCQLCYESVDTSLHYNDPMSATLDHIEPQSWALIPDHSPGNLRTAHRRCNSSRGDGRVTPRGAYPLALAA